MSAQTSSAQNGYIWQNKELNPDMTKICFVNRKFINDCPQFHLSDSIADIEQRTKCSIVIHGLQAEVVWFCIKHELAEQRLAAFNLINQALKFTLNEVLLPKLIEEEPRDNISSFRLSSPSPPPPSILNQPANDVLKFNQNNTHTLQNQSFVRNKEPFTQKQLVTKTPARSSMIRSTTESFISSLSYSKSAVNQSHFNDFNSKITKPTQLDKKLEKLNIDNNKYKLKNRYTVDFLLQRADTINSKKQPSNWKELNEKYPTVCFSGKVISYFDPYKYHQHWEKTKIQNSELHSNEIKYLPTMSRKYANNSFGYNHTDDFLNLNSFNNNKDFNNNNSYYNFKPSNPNRMTMIHSLEQQKFKRFEPPFYNNQFSNNDNNSYYIKKQPQQFDSRQVNQYDNGFRKSTMTKTHSNYNFN